MSRIGVFGGMGPSATVDFMDKLVQLTPAKRDQEHLPMVVANFPHVPDRSRAILGQGADPLPFLLKGIEFLTTSGAGVIAIPCNSSHHWYSQLCAATPVPILHIARCCVAAIPAGEGPVAVFATRGALASGFYQQALAERGFACIVPDPDTLQPLVDDCIRQVKAAEMAASGASLGKALAMASEQGAGCVIMGCTEIPVAARHMGEQSMRLVDSSLELARATVDFALERGWNKPAWDC